MYRERDSTLEFFLVHPGGPFWAKKDAGAWSIPKGQLLDSEDPLTAARREFEEETGWPPLGDFIDLGEIKRPGGKIVSVWAFSGDADPAQLRSNRFQLEWPPRSGRKMEFPEIDRGGWFGIAEAHAKLGAGQSVFLDRLLDRLQLRPASEL